MSQAGFPKVNLVVYASREEPMVFCIDYNRTDGTGMIGQITANGNDSAIQTGQDIPYVTASLVDYGGLSEEC